MPQNRSTETRELDDVGAVAIEDQDGPGVDHNPGARDRLEGDVTGRTLPHAPREAGPGGVRRVRAPLSLWSWGMGKKSLYVGK
jgi:hypothetical protein